jgi:putative DNA base modification enzyme with NMAD domain
VAAFLANIGVNAGHAARSPLHADGSFTVLPIPEAVAAGPPMRTLADADLADLAALAPASWRSRTRAVHLDPDFRSDPPTYGDNCRTAGRAFNLRRAQPGDVIWFAARLHDGRTAAVHLVGKLTIEAIAQDITSDPGQGWWDTNAHVLRGRATDVWNSFWVFRGARSESGWLSRAIPLSRATLEALLGPKQWPPHATEQQVIAWHTRAIRRIA